MRFDLDDLNPGRWFPFDPSNPDGDGICLRVVPTVELRRMQTDCTIKGKGIDQPKFDAALWEYCIVDWRGVQDASGSEIECNAENKSILMGGAPDFSDFVTVCLDKIRESKLSGRELEKN